MADILLQKDVKTLQYLIFFTNVLTVFSIEYKLSNIKFTRAFGFCKAISILTIPKKQGNGRHHKAIKVEFSKSLCSRNNSFFLSKYVLQTRMYVEVGITTGLDNKER